MELQLILSVDKKTKGIIMNWNFILILLVLAVASCKSIESEKYASSNVIIEINPKSLEYRFKYFVPIHSYCSNGYLKKVNDSVFTFLSEKTISEMPIEVQISNVDGQYKTIINFNITSKEGGVKDSAFVLVMNDGIERIITNSRMSFQDSIVCFYIKKKDDSFFQTKKIYNHTKSNQITVSFHYEPEFDFLMPLEKDTLIFNSGKQLLWKSKHNNEIICVKLGRTR